MIFLPREIVDVLTNDEDGDIILKDEATEEQRRIYNEFFEDLRSGKLTDREVWSDGKRIVPPTD